MKFIIAPTMTAAVKHTVASELNLAQAKRRACDMSIQSRKRMCVVQIIVSIGKVEAYAAFHLIAAYNNGVLLEHHPVRGFCKYFEEAK